MKRVFVLVAGMLFALTAFSEGDKVPLPKLGEIRKLVVSFHPYIWWAQMAVGVAHIRTFDI